MTEPAQSKPPKKLTEWVARNYWDTILLAYSCCVRITRGQLAVFSVQWMMLYSWKMPSEVCLSLSKLLSQLLRYNPLPGFAAENRREWRVELGAICGQPSYTGIISLTAN